MPATVSGDSGEETVRIQSRLKGENFILPLSDLLYIESDGNYVPLCRQKPKQLSV